MRITILTVCCLVAMWLCSCSNTVPTACFQLTLPPDSIYVGHPVGFDATCSQDASKFYWDFGNGQTISNNPTPQMTYDSAGTYRVALIVGSSNKSASIAIDLHVKP